MASALPRPRQVTVAGWVIMAGSAAVVLAVFQQIAGLHSIDTREAFTRTLSEPPFDALGLSVDEVLLVVRVLSMVAAACATATAILGWQALQRSKSARVALSILAAPLFVSGLGTGGILSTAVAAAIALLWAQPARDWFDGRWRPAPAEERTPPAERPTPPSEHAREVSQQPPPYSGWPPAGSSASPPASAPAPGVGVPAPQASWPPPQGSWPPPQAGHAPTPPAGTRLFVQETRRPPAVLAAVVLTWVCSVLLGALFVAGAAWLIASPETLMDEMRRQNPELVRDGTITVGLLRGTLGVMGGIVAVWSLAACVVAFFVLRRAAWARVLLILSSAAAGLGLLACTMVNTAMVVPLVGASAAFALLLRRDVGDWFRQPR
jgi:hypothetical protein